MMDDLRRLMERRRILTEAEQEEEDEAHILAAADEAAEWLPWAMRCAVIRSKWEVRSEEWMKHVVEDVVNTTTGGDK
jgi:hypothetical protein